MAIGAIILTKNQKTDAKSAYSFRTPVRADIDDILAFANALPPHDLLYLRRDITQRSVTSAWIDSVASGNIHSFIAEHDGQLVGTSGLFRDNRSWSPHVGEIRVLVSEAHRRQGLGRLLIEKSIYLALELGLEKMIAQMTIDQTGARQVFEESGFLAEALLKDHVKDRSGETHDILILSCNVDQVTNQMVLSR